MEEEKDLPRPHLNTLTQAGYAIIAFDYPLAPAAKLEMIMNDVESSIQYYINHSDELIKNPKSSEDLSHIFCGDVLPALTFA